MKEIFNSYNKKFKNIESIISSRMLGLFAFNIIMMILILMRSAGYFAPFLPLSINIIVLICLIISIPLLGVRDKMIFSIALLLWIFAALLRLLNVDVWAERTAVYCFEALAIGMVVFVASNFKSFSNFKS